MIRLTLHGHFKGQTVTLNGYRFVKGVLELPGDMDHNDGIVKYFARSYQAYPDGVAPEVAKYGTSEIPASPQQGRSTSVPSRVQQVGTGSTKETTNLGTGTTGTETGTEGSMANGDGYSNPRLHQAIMSLDPNNNGHWTQSGKPAIAALEAILGVGNITRKDVELVAPDFDRETAVKPKK